MKHLFTLLLAPACCLPDTAHCQTPESVPTPKMPVIEVVPQELVDTIRLDSGDRNSYHVLQLRNNGDAPLMISSIKSSDPCYCSSWPKEPVMPGTTAELRVACPPMRSGPRQQTFSIESNAGPAYLFKVKRIGVGPIIDPRSGPEIAK